MTKPGRIQRKRVKGWRMPENTVSVTRPGRWGNPFVVGGFYKKGDPGGYHGPFQMLYCQAAPGYEDETFTKLTTDDVLVWYEWYLVESKKDLSELRGKNLACFCPLDQPCHADVLLRLANKE